MYAQEIQECEGCEQLIFPGEELRNGLCETCSRSDLPVELVSY